MALFEFSVLSFAITTISPKVVLEQKLVLLKYTSDISDVIFHAEVKKQTGFSVPTTEQGLNAFDRQGVTIRELTVFIHEVVRGPTPTILVLCKYYSGQYSGFPLQTKGSGWSSQGEETITKCDHEAMEQFS